MEAFLDYELGGEPPRLRPKASEEAVRTDLAEGARKAEIRARLREVRVPTMLVRAEDGLAPGQPPLFPDSVVKQIMDCLPEIEEQIIPRTTHYTITLGDHGASRLADLIDDFARRCLPTGHADLG